VKIQDAPTQVGSNFPFGQKPTKLATQLCLSLTTDTIECEKLMRAFANVTGGLGKDLDRLHPINE
jgi:hypothetical protein